MNQKIKISQLPAKGSNLAAADLLEIAEFTGTGYISKSITGQELIDAIPAPSVDWGDIGGTLSDQTDLNTALSGKVPTSRTLTINGTTQDLSADRTFTISTGITIGTTAITSGTVGRVLFEGTGNVVQESANLFWDNTNARLGVGISAPLSTLHVVGSATSGFDAIRFKGQYSETGYLATSNGAVYFASGAGVTGSFLELSSGTANLRGGTTAVTFTVASERMRINNAGNVLINTTTDAGFRLDVNGTARVSGNTTINGQLTTTTAFPTIRAYSANTTDSAGFQCATNNGSGNNASFITYAASVGFGLGGNAGFGSGTSIIVFGNSSAFSGGTTSIRLRPGGFDTAADALIAYQNSVSIGTTNIPVASAVLDVVSTTKGFLPPRMTTTQKNAIASPAAGLMVYDTTLNVISYYNGTSWI